MGDPDVTRPDAIDAVPDDAFDYLLNGLHAAIEAARQERMVEEADE